MSITTKPSWQDNDALLTYRVGPVLCCGPTLPIITITPPPSLTHLPGTNIAEPGIFKHGKYIVSATDLRYRFGVKQENWKQPGQVIIAQHGDQTRGYYVDEIKDVIHFPETGWGQLPAYLPRGIFTRTLLLNEQIYLYTEFEKLYQLQGSGYLAEYISRLEETNQEDIKQPEETKQIEKSKAQSTNIQPTEKKKITSTTVTDDTNQKNDPTERSSDKTNIVSLTPKIQTVDTSKSNKPLDTADNVISKNSIRPGTKNKGTAIKELAGTEVSSTDNGKIEKHNETFSKHEKNTTETISATKNKQNGPTRTSSRIENKTPVKITSHERIATNLINSKTKTDKSNAQSFKPFPNESLAKIEKNVPNQYPEDTKPVETGGNFIGLFIIFLILLIGAGGGYYYISHSTKEKNIATQSVNVPDTSTSPQTYAAVQKDTPLLIADSEKSEVNEINLATPDSSTTESKQVNTNSIHSASNLNQNQTTESSNSENSNPETSNTNIPNTEIKDVEYHASIKQEHDTITIELDGPLPPVIINLDNSATASDSPQVLLKIENELNAVKTDTLATNSSAPILPKAELLKSEITEPESSKQKPEIYKKTKSVVIIHIIVKGDTLWAIAKHYLLNPFRYPELAKLSKIKNPDLIYPGNRVRIIYKNNANK